MPEQAWRPSRATAILIGIVSAWPIVYMCFFVASMAYFFIAADSQEPAGLPELFKYVFILHLLTILLMFVLLTVYIVHAYRTDLVPNDKKVLWVVILFFGNFIAIPIYWYLYMWRPVSLYGIPNRDLP